MTKLLLGALAVAAATALPTSAFAQVFAYVNTTGEVMTMDANSANEALLTAPNLHVRSGVMLVDDAADNAVVGDDVPGT
ncbi:MAG TPA: hypothetical protein VEB18_03940 [Candidatus Paceibacterota bacterium]|nr:hypothetical protein [Candidatus Paceibacterota bacterium]